jgi:aldehyde:ferredoxin oxidoreductase
LGSYLLSQNLELKDKDPANQPIAISAGPLVGTGIPLATRTAVSARNLLSQGFCYSNVGGDFGTRLKMAGYDMVVVEGKSARPVYLFVHDSLAEILPADQFWGLCIGEFQAALFRKYAETKTSFIGIGPAGERGATIACLIVDRAHAAAWGGSGAIFGAKKLKAVVAVGSQPIAVYEPDGLQRKINQLAWRINASEAAAALVRGGTHGMAGAGGFSHRVPIAVKNMQDEFLPYGACQPIREETFKQWETGRTGCIGCSIRCLHQYEVDSAKHGRLEVEGMHANSIRGLGTNLGVDSAEDLLFLHKLCNEYGLDVDGVSAAAAFALECAAHGILDPEQPGGVRLKWGDGTSLVKLVRQMGERKGLGALLSQGVAEAARKIGKGSEKYAMTVKGVGINEGGLRSHRAWSLGVMTSTRGGGHLGGSPQTENRGISAEVGERLFGNRKAGTPQSYSGKGKLVAWTEANKAVVDCLGLCYFLYGWYDLSIGAGDELAEMLYLATGIDTTAEQLHQQGQRIHTLERYLGHLLGGHTRQDDILPDRFFDTPVSSGPYQGERLDRSEVERALDEYYSALGWDSATGVPSSETMREMGLEHVL